MYCFRRRSTEGRAGQGQGLHKCRRAAMPALRSSPAPPSPHPHRHSAPPLDTALAIRPTPPAPPPCTHLPHLACTRPPHPPLPPPFAAVPTLCNARMPHMPHTWCCCCPCWSCCWCCSLWLLDESLGGFVALTSRGSLRQAAPPGSVVDLSCSFDDGPAASLAAMWEEQVWGGGGGGGSGVGPPVCPRMRPRLCGLSLSRAT